MPFLESEWRRNIRDALKARLLSRWVLFGTGAAGALFWVVATAATWAICRQFNSLAAIGVGLVLTFIWIFVGVAGSIGAVSELAKERVATACTEAADRACPEIDAHRRPPGDANR